MFQTHWCEREIMCCLGILQIVEEHLSCLEVTFFNDPERTYSHDNQPIELHLDCFLCCWDKFCNYHETKVKWEFFTFQKKNEAEQRYVWSWKMDIQTSKLVHSPDSLSNANKNLNSLLWQRIYLRRMQNPLHDQMMMNRARRITWQQMIAFWIIGTLRSLSEPCTQLYTLRTEFFRISCAFTCEPHSSVDKL